MSFPLAAPTLTTDRLILRALRDADAPRIAALANDAGVARMTTSIPHPFALEHAEGFIARMAGNDPAREIVLAIEHRQDGLIGVLGFHPKDGPAPEFGYWIGRPFWGNGYMTEAATAALDWTRAAWKKRLVIAGYFADNPASGGVLAKTGFLHTGVVEPRWSLARDAEAETRMMVWLA
ncbi:MAG TPA: GNAT family N-acetyltransferase [Caulobacteraceae bacterium]|nr:GNAT family N-acetyltransferase [Caulobacteraceae bacterium]